MDFLVHRSKLIQQGGVDTAAGASGGPVEVSPGLEPDQPDPVPTVPAPRLHAVR